MDISEIRIAIDAALKKLFDDDPLLLANNVKEECITHRFAMYLEMAINSDKLIVDVEYNKRRFETKYVRKYIYDEENPGIKIKTTPDVVVHQRTHDYQNSLIIEVCKHTKPKDRKELDRKKLKGYIEQINYPFGVFLEIGVRKKAGINKAEYYRRNENGLCETI